MKTLHVFNFRNIARCVDYLSNHEVAHNIFFSRAQPLRTSGAIQSEDKTNVLPQLVTAYIFPRVAVVGSFLLLLTGVIISFP